MTHVKDLRPLDALRVPALSSTLTECQLELAQPPGVMFARNDNKPAATVVNADRSVVCWILKHANGSRLSGLRTCRANYLIHKAFGLLSIAAVTFGSEGQLGQSSSPSRLCQRACLWHAGFFLSIGV